jgi:hypothetical protein
LVGVQGQHLLDRHVFDDHVDTGEFHAGTATGCGAFVSVAVRGTF